MPGFGRADEGTFAAQGRISCANVIVVIAFSRAGTFCPRVETTRNNEPNLRDIGEEEPAHMTSQPAPTQDDLNRQLIDALENNDVETAIVLVNAGADPNTLDGPPPMTFVGLAFSQPPYYRAALSSYSWTAFIKACGLQWELESDQPKSLDPTFENLPLIQVMLTHGADVHAYESSEWTALYNAVRTGKLRTVELLIQHGANVNAPVEDGGTPLMCAVACQSVDMIGVLLSHGANPNIQDAWGTTALYCAVNSPNAKSVIPELLAHGADPNLCTRDGYTPLKYAHRFRRSEAVRALKRGAGR